MNELQTSIISQLKEVADEYKLLCHLSSSFDFIYFIKYEVGIGDPSFIVLVDWVNNTANIITLNKVVELKDLLSCVRLLAEVIS